MTFHDIPDGKPHLNSYGQWLRVLSCGMCMGAADLIPGFSGGTVAFIMGIYSDLIRSVVSFNANAFRLLFSLRFAAFFHVVAWEFLAALGLGIGISVATFVRIIHAILENPVQRTYLFATFFGLVIASVLFCARQVTEWRWKQLGSLLSGGVIAFAITGMALQPSTDGNIYDVALPATNISMDHSTTALVNYDNERQRLLAVPEAAVASMLAKGVVTADTTAYSHRRQREGTVADFVAERPVIRIDPWLFFCGFVAITALLLPGMSGCYMLTILGAYTLVIGALSDLVNGALRFTLDVEAAFIMISLGLGAIIGLATSSRVVRWLLHHYRNITVAAMTGFMLGALRSVWPFWSYQYQLLPSRLQDGPQLQLMAPLAPDIVSMQFWIAIFFCVAGFSVVFILEGIAKRMLKA